MFIIIPILAIALLGLGAYLLLNVLGIDIRFLSTKK